MSESRRKFLRAGLCAALFAALPLKNAFSQSFKERDGNPGETPSAQTDPLVNYSKSSFVSYLNSIFQIQTAAGVVAVTLAKVDDMPAPRDGECFSLLFRGGSLALKQNTYVVVHPALGTFQLLLVPGGSDRNGAQEYLATINRLSLADFSRVTAPTRSVGAGQSNRSTSGSSAANPTTTPSSTPIVNTSMPTVTTPSVIQPAIIVVPKSAVPQVRRRKRKPASKRVDTKSAVIN
jgi:hypothetical protein